MKRMMTEGEYAYVTYSTGHSAFSDIKMPDANKCIDADSVNGTGHNTSTANVKTNGAPIPWMTLLQARQKLKISTKFETQATDYHFANFRLEV